jgi:hypothetical protein
VLDLVPVVDPVEEVRVLQAGSPLVRQLPNT